MSDVPRIFDRALAARRLLRAAQGTPAVFLLERLAEDLAFRLHPVLRQFSSVLDFGTPGHQAKEVLRRRNPQALLRHMVEQAGIASLIGAEAVDLEQPELAPESHDCIVSLLVMQGLNDVPGVLAQLRRALRPDGLFLGAMLGGDSLFELRRCLMDAELEITGGAAPRVFPFADVRAYGQLLQRAGFALPVADSDVVSVRYGSPLSLLADLRAMGATNVLVERSKRPLRRAVLMRAMALYAERFSDADGRVRATFEVIWLSGWAPHHSQQKPLKPGAAKMRLADVLNVKEHKG